MMHDNRRQRTLAKEPEPLDANSRRQGRSRSLGQVTCPVAAYQGRPRPVTLLYLRAVRSGPASGHAA
jgi:hypothetical protein